MSDRILIVDDEVEIADLIETYLQSENYSVSKCYSAKEALDCIQTTEFDLAVLDIMMPEIDGLTLCRKIRERYTYPVIMLTARDGETDKITGLTLGADDYVTKPFRPLELVARVKAHLSRYERLINSSVQENDIIEIRGLKIDKTARRVWINEEEKQFTTKEFDLLVFLAQNPNRVFTKDELFKEIWDRSQESVFFKKIFSSLFSLHIMEVNPTDISNTQEKQKRRVEIYLY